MAPKRKAPACAKVEGETADGIKYAAVGIDDPDAVISDIPRDRERLENINYQEVRLAAECHRQVRKHKQV